MLSTLLRTIPAISLDVMAADFGTSPQKLGSLTSIYHFAFAASQIPVGAAMDRFGVRPVSLSLLIGTVFGALASGLATGPESFLFGQFLLGVATSGMLMCPMTLAAKNMSRGALRPVVRHHPLDRQYRHAAVVEPAGLCGRSLGMAGGVLDLGRLSASWWRSPCSRWCRGRRPRMPTARRRLSK